MSSRGFWARARGRRGSSRSQSPPSALLARLAAGALAVRRRAHDCREAESLRRTQRELAVTNERYRSLFHYHPASVFSLDLDGHFVEANRASEGLVGYSLAQMQQKHFAELVAPRDAETTLHAFEAVLRREPQEVDVRLRHRDGRPIDARVTSLPIVVDDEVVGVYGIAVDTTEDNRIRRELAAALACAEEASEAKSRFLANVSHEIRTPLTSLLGTTELLEDTGLDEQQARFVEVVNRSGQRLLTLVNDLLDLARIEAGETRVERRAFDVRRLVCDVVSLYAVSARRKGLELLCELPATLPRSLLGDPDRIGQVLTNLLDNAVKFTEHGWVAVRVALDQETGASRATLRVDVADSGIGVNPADLASLFEAFHQVDTSITRKYGGAGLGLSLSQELVQLLGGSLGVESAPGLGSTFTARLPLEVLQD